MIINPFKLNYYFSANNRNMEKTMYGYSQAELIQVRDLTSIDHDCKLSPDSGCAGCEEIKAALISV